MNRILLTSYFRAQTGGVYSHMLMLDKIINGSNWQSELLIRDFLPPLKEFVRFFIAGRTQTSCFKEAVRLSILQASTRKFGAMITDTIMNKKIDMVHFHDPIAMHFADKITPQILTVHGPVSREQMISFPEFEQHIQYLRDIERESYSKADRIISVDSGQKQILVEDFAVSEDKIEVIYNAVDTDFFKPAESDHSHGEKYILVPRRLAPKNGVHVAIEAMVEFAGDDLQLWIAGDGGELADLERLVQARKLGDKVRFLGSVSHAELIGLIQKSEAVVIPSVPIGGVVEATSIAALEGMSCGKVVIASNIGGLAEIIKNGETGLLFEAGNAEELAAAVRKIHLDLEFKKMLQVQAREYVVSHHSLPVWFEKVRNVYDRCLH